MPLPSAGTPARCLAPGGYTWAAEYKPACSSSRGQDRASAPLARRHSSMFLDSELFPAAPAPPSLPESLRWAHRNPADAGSRYPDGLSAVGAACLLPHETLRVSTGRFRRDDLPSSFVLCWQAQFHFACLSMRLPASLRPDPADTCS